jgi:hypothetical protein
MTGGFQVMAIELRGRAVMVIVEILGRSHSLRSE